MTTRITGKLAPLQIPDRAKHSQSVICILGMHRSGTSCLTGCLQDCGLYLGEVVNQAPHNKKGNKENLTIRAINDQILLTSGGSWHHPPEELSWNDEICRSRDELISTYSAYSQWGFKDPRTVLTLPFWLDALPDLNLIGTFRHPAAVAHSLAKRGDTAIEAGLNLWKTYNLKLLDYINHYNFPLVCFDWPMDIYIDSIINFSNNIRLNQTARKRKITFYDENLRQQHHANTEGKIPSDILDIYDTLKEISTDFNY